MRGLLVKADLSDTPMARRRFAACREPGLNEEA